MRKKKREITISEEERRSDNKIARSHAPTKTNNSVKGG